MQLPNGWFNSKLINLCEVFTDGDWIESKDQSTEGIRLVQTGNIGLGEFKNRRDKARWISLETFEKLKCQEIFEGDCLISRLPDPVGRSCIIPNTGDRMVTAVDCTILRFKDNLLVPEYFNYYTQSYTYQQEIKQNCSGATRERISRKNLGITNIVYPDVKEQKHIVAILDEAFAGINQAIANTEKNLANARELFESYLDDVFISQATHWEKTSLGECCKTIQDGAHHSPKITYNEWQVGLFPYITSKNIRNSYMKLDKVEYVDSSFHNSIYPRCTPELGDILLTKDGANTGNVTLNTLDEPFSLLSSVCLIKVNANQLNNSFLKYYIQSPTGLNQITGQMTGAAIKRIILKTIKASKIPLPDINTQNSIVKKLDGLYVHLQKLEDIYQQKLQSLTELKQSLLQKAFSGELTANNVDKLVNP